MAHTGPQIRVHTWKLLSPRFFKKAKGILLSPPSVRPLCYLLLNHWTKFNQIWCMSYSHEWGAQGKFFFGPAPWGPGEGSKGQISFNFNYKVNFKDFYSKLCVCSHKWKIQNISDGYFILSSGSCPRGGTWGNLGAKIEFRPAVCPLCYLLNHWKKINQIWCVSYSHEWGARRKKNFWPRPLGPWGGVKRSNII